MSSLAMEQLVLELCEFELGIRSIDADAIQRGEIALGHVLLWTTGSLTVKEAEWGGYRGDDHGFAQSRTGRLIDPKEVG